MPFIFRRVYLLTRSDDPRFQVLAMGVHRVFSEKKPTYSFTTNTIVPGHQVVGEMTRDDEATIEVTEEGGLVWRFDVLTKELWVNMPRRVEADQHHVDQLAAFFQTEEAVQEFLLDEYMGDFVPESAVS